MREVLRKTMNNTLITKTSLISTFLGLYQSELSTGDKYIQKASLTQYLTKLYNILSVYYTHMPISLFAFHWCFLSVKGMYELL